jgi:multiphosphoryl transfer protein
MLKEDFTVIGLVIVSHSLKIAEGLRDLAQQIIQDRLPIALAAGIDNPENPIGTDAVQVAEAIKSVYSDSGVIVFMDLGSAVLSAETALDLLEPAWRENIYLCTGPLIEGVIAASVQAMIGQPVQNVLAEANSALDAKHAHFAESGLDALALWPDMLPSAKAKELRLPVPNKRGLHTRPAAQLVKILSRYKASLTIGNKGRFAKAQSINQIAMLGARQDDELSFYADGEDADALLAAIQAFADDNFGERHVSASDWEYQMDKNHPEHVSVGIPASQGIAIAEAYSITSVMPEISQYRIQNHFLECQRLTEAINSVAEELKQLAQSYSHRLGQHDASIFEAQGLILQDPELLKAATQGISKEKINAEVVWWGLIEELARRYSELDDPVLSERASDIRELGKRVLQKLAPESLRPVPPTKPYILLASELLPLDLAQLNEKLVMGIITAQGGISSHSTIIARALAVPAVIGFSELAKIQSGQLIAMDGEKGWVWTALDSAERKELEEAMQDWLSARDNMRLHSKDVAISLDGKKISLAANIGRLEEVYQALELGAEGIGLFRSEYLFMNRDTLPTEEEQFELYTQAGQQLNGFPLVIRSLDIGGDKALKSIPFEQEANPFLGYRGIRYWLDAPEIYKSQLRAIYRASATCNIKLMLPMISTINELERAKVLMESVRRQLEAERIPHNPKLELGIMIEVPSAVLIADQLARQVSFFSIGTNDLSQYIMAADRNNSRLQHLADYFQPALLRAIQYTIEAAHREGISVSVCGEMAADSLAVPLLIAMGVDNLSMNPASIPEIKAAIRSTTSGGVQDNLEEILSLPSPEHIKARLRLIRQGVSL